MNDNFISEAGYQKLKKELEYLKKVKRKEIASEIQESRDFGDISENSEFEEARNEQAFVEGKIKEIEHLLKNAKIIKSCSSNKVGIGCQVVLATNKKEIEYNLVGSAETDPSRGKISVDSPLGQALAGKKVGEKVSVDTISGPTEYKIIRIK